MGDFLTDIDDDDMGVEPSITTTTTTETEVVAVESVAKPKTKSKTTRKPRTKRPRAARKTSKSTKPATASDDPPAKAPKRKRRKTTKSKDAPSVSLYVDAPEAAPGGSTSVAAPPPPPPVALDLTGGATVGDDGQEASNEPVVDPKRPALPRMSETIAAMRDVAREEMPSDASERVLTAHSISYLTTDPTREEDKATLVSMATTSGEPIQAPLDANDEDKSGRTKKGTKRGRKTRKTTAESKKGTPKTKRTSKRRKKASPNTPVVHELTDIPPSETWGPSTPSEAQAKQGQLPPIREIEKHPGKIKTAGLGVAIPPPGNLGSALRQKLDASNLSNSGVEQDKTPAAGAVVSNGDTWETDTPAAVAKQLDARRMDAPVVTGGRPAQPLSQLMAVFSDQDRLSQSDCRTQLSRYLSGLVERQLLETDYAAKLVHAEMIQERQARNAKTIATALDGVDAEDDSVTTTTTPRPVSRKSHKGSTRILNLEAGEQDILRVMCGPEATAAVSDESMDLDDREARIHKRIPRVGIGAYLDMPIDEAEVAVAITASLPEAMVYFTSFDDSVKAMDRVYDSVMHLASLPPKLEALRTMRRISNGQDTSDRKNMIQRLGDYQKELEAKLEAEQEASKTSDSPVTAPREPSTVWVQRHAVSVLLAILTGRVENNRLNIVRTMVAMEETLMNGLYREPAMRCFLNDKRQQPQEPDGEKADSQTSESTRFGHGWADSDVINVICRNIQKQQQQEQQRQQGDTDTNRPGAPHKVLGSGQGLGGVVLPRLGESASMAYCKHFLRAPDPQRPLERCCARGERGCVSWILSAHAAWPATGGLNRASHAFVMREFYPPDRWQRIQQDQSLPKERAVCLLCDRFTATYYWLQLRLLDARAVTGLWNEDVAKQVWRGTLLGQSHCNTIEPENGYTEKDMLPIWKATDGPWTGIVQPMRAFRANDYIPGEVLVPTDPPQNPQQPIPTTDTQGEQTPPPRPLPCFYERTAADFR